MKKQILLITMQLCLTIALLGQQVDPTNFSNLTDNRDGHVYKTVKIGTQIWMAENMAIKVTSGCWGYENNQKNANLYGYLYNWKTANIICPTGWHLPTDDEWSTLINFLGGDNVAGSKLKEKGNDNWLAPNTDADNSSGFTALPGTTRMFDGSMDGFGTMGSWWTATATGTRPGSDAKAVILLNAFGTVSRGATMTGLGNSVRCVKDLK